ncbi:MAG TPA: Gp49 family protein [Pseudoneobacillus sp.]|nr:Gp49 family protein [Pseudoneobacillus sp.]
MNDNKVTQEQVDEIFRNSKFRLTTFFDKVTVLAAELPNGFTIVESSGCVDPANYDQNLGAELCMAKIKDKIWFLLGYQLQENLYIQNKKTEEIING